MITSNFKSFRSPKQHLDAQKFHARNQLLWGENADSKSDHRCPCSKCTLKVPLGCFASNNRSLSFIFFPCIVNPTEPTGLVLEIKEIITLRITWKEPKCFGQHGISGYIICYKITGKAFGKISILDCCDYKITNLLEGTAYEVSIVAVDRKGKEGTKSGIKTTKTGGKLQNLKFETKHG